MSKEIEFTDDELNLFIAFNKTVKKILIEELDYNPTKQFDNKVNHFVTSLLWKKKIDLKEKEISMDQFEDMICNIVEYICKYPYKFKYHFNNYKVTEDYKKPFLDI